MPIKLYRHKTSWRSCRSLSTCMYFFKIGVLPPLLFCFCTVLENFSLCLKMHYTGMWSQQHGKEYSLTRLEEQAKRTHQSSPTGSLTKQDGIGDGVQVMGVCVVPATSELVHLENTVSANLQNWKEFWIKCCLHVDKRKQSVWTKPTVRLYAEKNSR